MIFLIIKNFIYKREITLSSASIKNLALKDYQERLDKQTWQKLWSSLIIESKNYHVWEESQKWKDEI